MPVNNTISPVLSIVMPIFNNAELAIKMIASIRNNDFDEWELLAVDDGSDDENFKSVEAYCKSDSRIHYARRNELPKGAQTCRNIGLKSARGKYIIFFDSDDYVTPFCLGRRVCALKERTELDFLVFPSGVVQNDVFSDDANEFAYGYKIFEDDLDAFARRVLPFVVWNNIYRTDALRKNGILWDVNLRSLQDADFNVQTLLSGMKYDYFAGPADIGYRIDASSGSVSKKATSVEHRKSIIYAVDKFYRLYTGRFDNKYSNALYHGVLFLYNWILSDGLILELADGMCDVMAKYSKFYAWVFRFQIVSTKFIQLLIPKKRARQIPMALHLIDNRKRIQNKQIAIKNIIQK